MQLRPRTTYVANSGRKVHIAGPVCGSDLDGIAAYWSIEGDHYLIDGRRISGRTVQGDDGPRYERFALPAESSDSIRAEYEGDDSAWWAGVDTERRR